VNLVRFGMHVVIASFGWVGIAHAQTCTPILAVPVVIAAPGTYCVTGHLTTSQSTGAAIEIQADNVVLDFTYGGIEATSPDNSAAGVYALDRNGISVFNGSIQRFAYGVLLENSASDFSNTSGHVVADMDIVLSRVIAIEVRGVDTRLTGNLVESTGNGPVGSSVGINVFGPGAYLYRNSIIDTAAQADGGGAIDIQVFGGGCDLEENRLVNTVSAQNLSYGVILWSATDCLVRNNMFDNRTTTPLDIGVYIVDGKHVQLISNTFSNVVRNSVR
jgi:hypothetical protein